MAEDNISVTFPFRGKAERNIYGSSFPFVSRKTEQNFVCNLSNVRKSVLKLLWPNPICPVFKKCQCPFGSIHVYLSASLGFTNFKSTHDVILKTNKTN